MNATSHRSIRTSAATAALALLAAALCAAATATYTVVTHAGTGTAGYAGDGGPATSAELNTPRGVAVGYDKSVYIADAMNKVVRKVDGATGNSSTAAGGAAPQLGDGGPATAAWMTRPNRVAVDAVGNVFIADTDNHRIRKIDAATGDITTVAGTGAKGFGGDGGAATAASLDRPEGIAVTGGGGGTGACLIVVKDPASLGPQEVARKTLVESFGWTTSLIDQDDPQAAFDAAVTTVDVAYVPSSTSSAPMSTKLKSATVGVVLEQQELVDDYGFASAALTPSQSQTTILDNSHEITSPFATGPLTIFSSAQGNHVLDGTLAGGLQQLAETLSINPPAPASYLPSLAVIETGGALYGGGSAAGRRVNLPWGDGDEDINALTANGRTILERALDWAAGGGGGPAVIYVADTNNHRVRKFEDGGTISTVAGAGTAGFSGDGGAATSAQLDRPLGLTIRDGAIYVADSANHRVRKFTEGGSIATIAGDGTAGFAGDGGDPLLARFDTPSDVATRAYTTTGNFGHQTAFGSLDGSVAEQTATQVTLSAARTITSVTAYVGNQAGQPARFALYADSAGEPGALVVESATQSTAGAMAWLTLDVPDTALAAGAYWLALALGQNQQDYGYDAAGGQTRVTSHDAVGSGFQANWSGTTTSNTRRVSIYARWEQTDVEVHVADRDNHRVRRFEEGGSIATTAGDGTAGYGGDGGAATSASLNRPVAVAIDASGNVFIGDTDNHRVRRVDAGTGTLTTYAGTGTPGYSGNGGPATAAMLNRARGLAFDASGNLFLADTANHAIRKVDGGTGTIALSGGTPGDDAVLDGVAATASALGELEDVALDDSSNLYVVSREQSRVRKIDTGTGLISTLIGAGDRSWPAAATEDLLLEDPAGIAVDGDGNVFVADRSNHRIVKYTVSGGTYATIAGTGVAGFSGDAGPAASAQLDSPQGVAVDGDGNVYVADTANHRIRKIEAATGDIATVAGSGLVGYFGDGGAATAADLDTPVRVAVDVQGKIYLADQGNHVIRRVDTAGTITTLVGSGSPGFAGDGGDPTLALLDDPVGIGFKRSGSSYLYFGDRDNHRVRVADYLINGARVLQWQEVDPLDP